MDFILTEEERDEAGEWHLLAPHEMHDESAALYDVTSMVDATASNRRVKKECRVRFNALKATALFHDWTTGFVLNWHDRVRGEQPLLEVVRNESSLWMSQEVMPGFEFSTDERATSTDLWEWGQCLVSE